MGYTILPRTLYKHRVYIRERIEGGYSHEFAFDCEAEEMLHAMEQATDAYPGCFLNAVTSHRIDEQTDQVEQALALGFTSIFDCEEHQKWLDQHSTRRDRIRAAVRDSASTGSSFIDVRFLRSE